MLSNGFLLKTTHSPVCFQLTSESTIFAFPVFTHTVEARWGGLANFILKEGISLQVYPTLL